MKGAMEPLPDLAHALRRRPQGADRRSSTQEENEVSFRRRLLQGRIDILRAERTARLKGKGVTDVDVEKLTDILSSRSAPSSEEGACEPRLLPGVRVPEPGGLELLLPLRRDAEQGRVGRADDDLHARGASPTIPAPALHDLARQGPGARRSLRRRQGGGELLPVGRAHADRPLARVRRLPRRRHRLAPARRARARAARPSRSPTSAASTAPSSTASGSSRPSSRTTTSCRSASTA